jgi:hypothetical protein
VSDDRRISDEIPHRRQDRGEPRRGLEVGRSCGS